MDDFVDRFARRIASFEKKALTEAKRLVNRSSLIPDDTRLAAFCFFYSDWQEEWRWHLTWA